MPATRVLIWSFATLIGVAALELCIYLLLPESLQADFFRFSLLSIMVLGYCVIGIALVFLIPTIKGAIYFPSSERQITDMLALANLTKKDTVVDIGSGDGRVVAALAPHAHQADGIELNPLLVWYSKWKYGRSLPNTHFAVKNLWLTNFSQYDVIILFGMTYIMADLEKKLLKELRPGTRVIANSFPFPTWKHTKKRNGVYLYMKE